MTRCGWGALTLCAALVVARPVQAQSTGPATEVRRARTIVAEARDVIPLQSQVRYTTLIALPDGEEVVEATCGDKESWVVNVRGPWVSVKPAKPGSTTNLTLLTTSGRLYAFILTEISGRAAAEPDLVVYIEPDEPTGAVAAPRPQYVPAAQLEDFRTQAVLAREEARRATAEAQTALVSGMAAFRLAYPLQLVFPYRFKADKSPFFVQAIFHDDHRTFIQAKARELPALYELKDGAPNLVNFEVRQGTYIVPKVLEQGYLVIGKQRLEFTRAVAR